MECGVTFVQSKDLHQVWKHCKKLREFSLVWVDLMAVLKLIKSKLPSADIWTPAFWCQLNLDKLQSFKV